MQQAVEIRCRQIDILNDAGHSPGDPGRRRIRIHDRIRIRLPPVPHVSRSATGPTAGPSLQPHHVRGGNGIPSTAGLEQNVRRQTPLLRL